MAASCGEVGGADLGDVTSTEMEEIRKLHNPPAVVRRTLEAVFLLMNAARAPARPHPPEWQRVQKMLSDAGFLSKMLNFDAVVLQGAPVLVSFVASEYFGSGGGPSSASNSPRSRTRRATTMSLGSNSEATRRQSWAFVALGRRTSTLDETEPLTFDRVKRASRATAALFRWSALVLMQALDPNPPETKTPPAPVEEPPEPEPQLPGTPEEPAEPPEPEVPSTVSAPVWEGFPSQAVLARALALEAASMPNLAPTRPSFEVKPPTPEPVKGPEPRSAVPRPMPPMPAPAKKIMPLIPQKAKPDRHFELLAPFVFGSSSLAELGESALQTVAATYVMRRRLKLRLITSPDRIENDALARGRVNVAADWLLNQGFPAECMESCNEIRIIKSGEPGVVCEFILDNDNVLRDYYLLVAQGELPQDAGTKDTLNFARWLSANFADCKH